jgi:hypothetical protein
MPIAKIRYKLDTHENRDEASCEKKKRELQGETETEMEIFEKM